VGAAGSCFIYKIAYDKHKVKINFGVFLRYDRFTSKSSSMQNDTKDNLGRKAIILADWLLMEEDIGCSEQYLR